MLGYAAVSIGKPNSSRSTNSQITTGWRRPPRSGRRLRPPLGNAGRGLRQGGAVAAGGAGRKARRPDHRQNGKSSTLNGWLPSAILGTKVVDAVGDIRAHPTGDMGAIGMAGSPEQMIQTAVAATGRKTVTSNWSSAVPPPRSRRSCAQPPTSPAASSPPAAIRCAPPMFGATRRWADLAGTCARRSDHRCRSQGGGAVIDAIVKATSGTILKEGS